MRGRWIAVALGLVLVGTAGAWLGASKDGGRIVQPIDFSHAVHVKGEEMACNDCHAADTQARAGFADIKVCMECHKEAQGDAPDENEAKVREYGKAKKQIPWVQVNRNAGHVYFSHRVHVAFAGFECSECHGKVEDLEHAITEPTPALHDMDACMDCHAEHGGSLQCLACHD